VRFLSWNLALLERSAQAPSSWQDFHTDDTVRHLVLALEPDVVCMQELPRVPFVETLALLQATTTTHSGNLATLVTHEMHGEDPPPIRVIEGSALLVEFAATDVLPAFTLANVHLAPGSNGAELRRDQLARVLRTARTDEVVVVGDTNTRLEEAEALAEIGLVGDKPSRPTWNSRRNRFRHGGAEFSAYFTRWFATEGLTVTDAAVHDFPTEHADTKFWISDHFALSGTITRTA